jgi:phosphatidate cytidylyltransferase
MLKYRLIFGTIMVIMFTGLILLDAWIDGSITLSKSDDKPVQAAILCFLIILLMIPGQMEMARLAASKNLTIFVNIAAIFSILLATSRFWPQLLPHINTGMYILFTISAAFFATMIWQFIKFETVGVMANCGANLMSIIYLGLLSSFILAIRIDFGIWHLLNFIFVVKSADIGAYAVGMKFGKHKFSPKISPGKTWEGMAGAVIFACLVSILFSKLSGIMNFAAAAVFGVIFAFLGQLGDLAESLIKRDAAQKDSSSNIPGFGGLLDVIDSPLATAFCAYAFYILVNGR